MKMSQTLKRIDAGGPMKGPPARKNNLKL